MSNAGGGNYRPFWRGACRNTNTACGYNLRDQSYNYLFCMKPSSFIGPFLFYWAVQKVIFHTWNIRQTIGWRRN